MSTVSSPANAGQVTVPSTLTPEEVRGYIRTLTDLIQRLSAFLEAPPPPEDVTEPDERPIEHEPRPVRPSFGDTAHMAIRDDGTFMVSLEDIGTRSTEGRELVTFMILSDDEADESHDDVLDAIAWAAAKIVGGLPRKART